VQSNATDFVNNYYPSLRVATIFDYLAASFENNERDKWSIAEYESRHCHINNNWLKFPELNSRVSRRNQFQTADSIAN